MKGFWAIVRKELDRVLKDKKMLFSMFVLPVILVMGIVGLIFFLIDNLMDDVNEHEYELNHIVDILAVFV